MSIFLPGFSSTYAECSLCDLPAVYVAILRIKIFDPETNKLVGTELDLIVCEKHADIMDIQIDKTLKLDRKTIILP